MHHSWGSKLECLFNSADSTCGLLRQNNGAVLAVVYKNWNVSSEAIDGGGCVQEMLGLYP